MRTTTKSLEKNLAIETARVGVIENQLEQINEKLDSLIETIGDHHIENINRYNRLSERITVLEASKEQTKYIITIITILLLGTEFLLKYVIK